MIRGLFLLLVLAAGLAAAALFQGRMHHLRLAQPEGLPGWSRSVADDAGVRQGTAELPATGRWPAMQIRWTARMPGSEGWRWDVNLTGKGIALTGRATVSFLADIATVTEIGGSVDLARVIESPVAAEGIARVNAGEVTVTDLRGTPSLRGTLQAQLAAFRLDGADFGEGPLTVELEEDGSWRAALDLSGGVSAMQAALSGALRDRMAQLEVRFDDGAALPPRMRAMLSAAGQADGQAWQLSVPVPVR